MSLQNQIKGKLGEKIACNYLKSQGYKILDKNFRCLFGEIDIIAKSDKTLVFLEVKTRSTNFFGQPEEVINLQKLRNLKKTINYYLDKTKNNNQEIRIDVISLILKPHTEIKQFKNITGWQ